MYLNKVQIIGNITKDIEKKALPNGTSVANFGVATNRNYKDKDGNKKEEVEFHDVVAFGKQADTIAQYMKKGSEIYVEGRLQTRSWEQDGVKKHRTEVILETFQFGTKRESRPEEAVSDAPQSLSESDIDVSDIPF